MVLWWRRFGQKDIIDGAVKTNGAKNPFLVTKTFWKKVWIQQMLEAHYLIDPDANSISIFKIILISDSLERRNHVVKVA